MNWKLQRIDWHKHGQSWSWMQIKRFSYFDGNQAHWTWGRIAVVFERKEWT